MSYPKAVGKDSSETTGMGRFPVQKTPPSTLNRLQIDLRRDYCDGQRDFLLKKKESWINIWQTVSLFQSDRLLNLYATSWE